MMKIVGICGSPRKGGNTEQILGYCLSRIAELGGETELITLHDKEVKGCIVSSLATPLPGINLDSDVMEIW